MKLTILGYSGAYPTPESGTTSYLLESDGFKLAIDMGSGGFLSLQSHINPNELDALWLTHYHGDHIADVNVLQYYRQLNEASNILKIYAHDEDIEQFKKWTIPNVSEGIAYNHQKVTKVGPFDIKIMKTKHPVPTYAMRITERKSGKVLTFTADSGYMEEWIDFATGSHVFLADTFFLTGNERNNLHFTTKETADIANEANVSQIIATHLSDAVDKEKIYDEILMNTSIPIAIAKVDDSYHI